MSHSKLGQDTNSLRPGGRPGPPRQPKKEILKPTIMPQEVMEKKVKGLLVELYHNRDPTEALLALGDLKEGGAKLHLVVDCLFAYSLEGKGTSWDLLKTVLQKSRYVPFITLVLIINQKMNFVRSTTTGLKMSSALTSYRWE